MPKPMPGPEPSLPVTQVLTTCKPVASGGRSANCLSTRTLTLTLTPTLTLTQTQTLTLP